FAGVAQFYVESNRGVWSNIASNACVLDEYVGPLTGSKYAGRDFNCLRLFVDTLYHRISLAPEYPRLASKQHNSKECKRRLRLYSASHPNGLFLQEFVLTKQRIIGLGYFVLGCAFIALFLWSVIVGTERSSGYQLFLRLAFAILCFIVGWFLLQ